MKILIIKDVIAFLFLTFCVPDINKLMYSHEITSILNFNLGISSQKKKKNLKSTSTWVYKKDKKKKRKKENFVLILISGMLVPYFVGKDTVVF